MENFEKDFDELAEENPDLSTMRSIIWHSMFIALIVITVSANLLVIIGVITHKKPRSTTILFLANLSIADIIVSTLHVPFVYSSILNYDWPFETTFCTTTVFIRLAATYMSVATFMILSYKQYKCILNRAQTNRCKFSTILILLSIWILSSILSIPMLLLVRNRLDTKDGMQNFCHIDWSVVTEEIDSTPGIIFVSMYMISMYFIPFVWCVCISSLAKSSSKAPRPQSITGENHSAKILNSIATIKLVMCMLMIQFSLWLPLNMMEIFQKSIRNWTTDDYFFDVWLGVFWLAMSHGIYRPMIYYWIDPTIYEYQICRRSRNTTARSAPMNNVDGDLRGEISTVKNAVETISDRVVLFSDEVMANQTNIESLTLLVRNIETKVLELDHKVNMQYLEFIKPSAPFSSYGILPQRHLSECSTRPTIISKRRKSVCFGSDEMTEIPELRHDTVRESSTEPAVRYPRLPSIDSAVSVTSHIG